MLIAFSRREDCSSIMMTFSLSTPFIVGLIVQYLSENFYFFFIFLFSSSLLHICCLSSTHLSPIYKTLPHLHTFLSRFQISFSSKHFFLICVFLSHLYIFPSFTHLVFSDTFSSYLRIFFSFTHLSQLHIFFSATNLFFIYTSFPLIQTSVRPVHRLLFVPGCAAYTWE